MHKQEMYQGTTYSVQSTVAYFVHLIKP